MKNWEKIEKAMTLDNIRGDAMDALRYLFDMSEAYDLEPKHDSKKSFYGKARVTIHHDGSATLKSYDTNVAKFNADTGKIEKLWDGYSATTQRHINEFSEQMTGRPLWKHEWDKMEVIK